MMLYPKCKQEYSRLEWQPEGESMTEQSHELETNINRIMAKYQATGILNHVNKKQPIFGDFSEVPDYSTALDLVMRAQESFMQLPSKTRARFANDPAQFLDFVGNPENADALIEMGLAIPKTPPAATSSDSPTSSEAPATEPA